MLFFFFRWVCDAGFPVGQGAGFPVVAGMLNFRRSNGFWGWVEQEMKGYFCLCIKICFNLI